MRRLRAGHPQYTGLVAQASLCAQSETLVLRLLRARHFGRAFDRDADRFILIGEKVSLRRSSPGCVGLKEIVTTWIGLGWTSIARSRPLA